MLKIWENPGDQLDQRPQQKNDLGLNIIMMKVSPAATWTLKAVSRVEIEQREYQHCSQLALAYWHVIDKCFNDSTSSMSIVIDDINNTRTDKFNDNCIECCILSVGA